MNTFEAHKPKGECMSNTFQTRFSVASKFLIKHKATLAISLLLLSVAVPSLGFCEDPTQGLNSMADSLTKTIFAPWVKRTILVFGAGFGIVKSVMGGGWLPLVSWGGLGLAINFLPNLIEFISKMGS